MTNKQFVSLDYIFRSLANLTAHKRSFCNEQFEDVTHVFDTKDGAEAAQLQTVMVQAEEVDAICPAPEWDVESYSPSLELLKDAGVIRELEERPLVNRLLPSGKTGLQSVVERLAARAGAEHRAKVRLLHFKCIITINFIGCSTLEY